LDGGCPFLAAADEGAFIDIPVPVAESRVQRGAPASFDDHFSQARLFFRSLTGIEQRHIIDAYTFELGKCYEVAIKERQLQHLADIDEDLCAGVAAGLGLSAPAASLRIDDVESSPALRMIGAEWPVDGRIVGIVVGPETDEAQLVTARDRLHEAGVLPFVIAPTGGMVGGVPVQRSFHTATSVELDGVIVLAATDDRRALALLDEAFRHGKGIAVADDAVSIFSSASFGAEDDGVSTGSASALAAAMLDVLPGHRVWERMAGLPA
jgi:catalase